MKTIPKNNIGEIELGEKLGVTVRRLAKVRTKWWKEGRLRLNKHWSRRGGRTSYTREGVGVLMMCLGLLAEGETTPEAAGRALAVVAAATTEGGMKDVTAPGSWTESVPVAVAVEYVVTATSPAGDGPVAVGTMAVETPVARKATGERLVVRKLTGNPRIILCREAGGAMVKVRVKNAQLFTLGQAVAGYRPGEAAAPWQLATFHPRWKGDRMSLPSGEAWGKRTGA